MASDSNVRRLFLALRYNLADEPERTIRSGELDEALLASRIEKVPGPLGDECWVWIGGRNNSGYGHVWYRSECHGAHRIAWELHSGPIPEGMWVLHKCDRPSCCNPSHLFLGTALR